MLRAVETLAVLHNELSGSCRNSPGTGSRGGDRRHNRELKKVRSFIRSRVTKNEFEYLFLENFEKMYQLAEQVLVRMESSGCRSFFRLSFQKEVWHMENTIIITFL